jgi:hypothetical protein
MPGSTIEEAVVPLEYQEGYRRVRIVDYIRIGRDPILPSLAIIPFISPVNTYFATKTICTGSLLFCTAGPFQFLKND